MSFDSTRWKIKRANEHIAEMDALLKWFHQPDCYAVGVVVDPKTHQKFVEYGFTKRFPSENFALIVGDVVHNFRSALDHAWITIARKLVPKTVGNYTKFPIFETLIKLEAGLGGTGMKGSSPDLYRFIVSNIKPYVEGIAVCGRSIASISWTNTSS